MITKILDWIRGKSDSGSNTHPLDGATRAAEEKAAPYKVEPLVDLSVDVSAETVTVGEAVTVKWSAANATKLTADGQEIPLSGSKTYSTLPVGNHAVEFVATGNDGTQAAKTAKVTVVDAPVIETAPVTVKAKFKKADLSKMSKKELLELAAKHGVEAKARAPKPELVKLLSKV